MSTARSLSAQKTEDVHSPPEQSKSEIPLLSTLTKIVNLLFHATRNRECSTDSPFALDTLRQAVKLTRPYLSRLRQELQDHGIELSSDNLNSSVFDATTFTTCLASFIRELARTREHRRNGSVRLTVLGGIYQRLDEEIRGARREVKRLEHLLEGKHTRRRHRKHEGESGGEEGVRGGELTEASASGGLVQADLVQDKQSTMNTSIHSTRVDAAAVRAQADTPRPLTTSPAKSSRLSQQSASHTSPILQSVDNTTRPKGSGKSTNPPSSHASSRRSRLTKAPTVCTSSDSKASSDVTSLQSTRGDKKSGESSQEAHHSPDRPASRLSKQSSPKPGGSRASSHGKASSAADSQISVHSGSAVATLGTGSKNKSGEVTPSIAEEKNRSRGTAPGGFVAFGDRLDGGWSFGGPQDGTGAS